MHAELFSPFQRLTDDKNKPLKNGAWFFYNTGTTNDAPVYQDSVGFTQHQQPVLANADGLFPPIYLDPFIAYRAVLKDEDENEIHSVDPAGPATEQTVLDMIGSLNGVSLANFKPDAPGAITRPVDRKLGERVSVRDFGALGDGLTDDGQAIQAAIDALGAMGGGTLWFPAGFYVIKRALTIKPRVWLVGDGHYVDDARVPQTTLNFADAGAGQKFCLKADKHVYNLRIERMLIKCDGSGWENLISLENSTLANLRDCYFSGGPTNAAIFLAATLYTRISENVFSLQGATKAIDAPEGSAEPDVGYYGTNGSVIERNQINVQGAVFVGNGDFTLRENGIEGRQIGTEAKIIIQGESVSYPKIIGNYLELKHPVDEPEEALPLRFILLKSNVNNATISENSLIAEPRKAGSVAFDLGGGAVGFDGQIENNWVRGFEHMMIHASTNSRYTFRNNNTSGSAGRSNIAKGLYLGDQWTYHGNVDGTSVELLEPQRHDLARYQLVDRSHWVLVDDARAGLMLRRGNAIAMNDDGASVDRIADAGLFPGAKVTFHARKGFTIVGGAATGIHSVIMAQGGEGYDLHATASLNGAPTSPAQLGAIELRAGAISGIAVDDPGDGYVGTPAITFHAGGSGGNGAQAAVVRQAPFRLFGDKQSCTLPAGSSIQFVVTLDRELVEVGNFSVSLP